jgi:hypothetical protein
LLVILTEVEGPVFVFRALIGRDYSYSKNVRVPQVPRIWGPGIPRISIRFVILTEVEGPASAFDFYACHPERSVAQSKDLLLLLIFMLVILSNINSLSS